MVPYQQLQDWKEEGDSYDIFAEGLGDGLGHNFPSLTSRLQERILIIAKENSLFAIIIPIMEV